MVLPVMLWAVVSTIFAMFRCVDTEDFVFIALWGRVDILRQVRNSDIVVTVFCVFMSLHARASWGQSLMFCIGMAIFCLPTAFVFVRHSVAAKHFKEHEEYSKLSSVANAVYYSIGLGALALVLSQIVIPGQFKGAAPFYALLVVLVLAKVESVHEFLRCFRRVVGARPATSVATRPRWNS